MKDLKDFDDEKPEIRWIKEKIVDLALRGFTGKVEINFRNGGITNTNTVISELPPKR